MLESKHYKLIFFVPDEQAEAVKEAVFATGAGSLGQYRRCAFETSGQGQFEPIEGANPFIGVKNSLEKVKERKVEILVSQSQLKASVHALLQAHPYEEVAWEAIPVIASIEAV